MGLFRTLASKNLARWCLSQDSSTAIPRVPLCHYARATGWVSPDTAPRALLEGDPSSALRQTGTHAGVRHQGWRWPLACPSPGMSEQQPRELLELRRFAESHVLSDVRV